MATRLSFSSSETVLPPDATNRPSATAAVLSWVTSGGNAAGGGWAALASSTTAERLTMC